MKLIKKYGASVIATAIGAVIGGVVLGVFLDWGDDKDIAVLKSAHNGYGG